jgi:hypothetical protein
MMLGDKGISQGETPAEADTSASPRSSLPLEGDGWVNWSGFGNSRNDTRHRSNAILGETIGHDVSVNEAPWSFVRSKQSTGRRPL